jgi:hypothetical protein
MLAVVERCELRERWFVSAREVYDKLLGRQRVQVGGREREMEGDVAQEKGD